MNKPSRPLLVGPLLQSFFSEHLCSHKDASIQTIASYRDTFRLLLSYVQQTAGIEPSAWRGQAKGPSFSTTRVARPFECAACLDTSVAKRFVSIDRIHPGKELLGRIVAMLTRLVDRFDVDESRALSLDPPHS